MSSMAMYSFVMIFGLENSGKNSPIIIYSMKEMSVCLGNEEEDWKEGGKMRSISIYSSVDSYLFYERDVCVPGNEKEDGRGGR